MFISRLALLGPLSVILNGDAGVKPDLEKGVKTLCSDFNLQHVIQFAIDKHCAVGEMGYFGDVGGNALCSTNE
jgi:hypothetical protein